MAHAVYAGRCSGQLYLYCCCRPDPGPARSCSKEAGAYGFLDGPDQSVRVMTNHGERYASINANTASREFSLFNECMHAKGYYQAPIDENDTN